MHPSARVLDWKSSATTLREIDKRAIDNLFSHPAFAPVGTKRKDVTPEMEAKIREVAAEAKADEEKAARKARPVQVKRWKV